MDRKEFKNKITYCANWDFYSELGFLNDLDYLSISAYFPLIEKDQQTTLENLLLSWKVIGEDLNKLSLKSNKPIVFGEIGYRSIENTAAQELNYNKRYIRDSVKEQRLCFKALDYAIKNSLVPIKKAYLWVGDTNIDSFDRTGFEIFNKPSKDDIIKYNKL